MHDVVNPAVIIGLGGTGKWALTYIKKNLLDTYGGVMPRAVRLLSFDTTSEKASRDGVPQEEDARVGDLQLDKQAEFVYLGGNIQEICRDIRDRGEHPHIGSWLQARTYLQTADSDAFDISRGAGQKRPFGRMAIFYDLQQFVQSKIANKIETALAEVIDANNHQAPVEIYIVASLAGGTGSGMVIDVAHLARWFAYRQVRTGFAIRGFLALQNTFRSVIKTEQVQPQVFSAMRELDRFMQVFDQQYPIVYDPNNQALQTIYGGKLGKLFDNCYLLDASREHMPLDGYEPKYGVYPSIADSITMLLDGSTGDAYAQHYKNVNTRIADVQSKLKQPIYSSMGSYSLILPVEDMIAGLSYRFAIDLLGQHLLNLEQRVNDFGQVQYLLQSAGDPRKDAAAFLRAPRSPSGVVSTNFIQRVAAVADGWRGQEQAMAEEIGGMSTAELLAWMLPPESDPTLEASARQVRSDLEVSLGQRVLPSSVEGDDPVDACDRIQQGVRDFSAENLGRELDGRRVGGVYRVALAQCATIHRDRYRKLLREHVVELLNGSNPHSRDYQHEKRGKLGQAQAELTQLARYFSDLSELLEQVKLRRASQDELRAAQEEATLCRLEMETKKGKRGALGVFVKQWQPAVQAQRAYIDAEIRVIDAEVKDLCFDALQQTGDMLRAVTEECKAAVDAWVATLVEGMSGPANDPGLLRYLMRGAAQYAANREEKRRIAVHEYLTDEAYEAGLYRSMVEGKADEALTRLIWGVDMHDGTFRLTLSGCSGVGGDPVDGRSATARNAQFFLEIARDYCAPLRDLNIADRLAERDPTTLAALLLERCGPLIRFDPAKSGGEQELRYFICVNEGYQKSYFNELREALKRLGASARDHQILNSSNTYTCTILATADVIASSSLLAYTSAEREYNNYPGDARLLHIFPAEVTAVQLEQQLPRIREPRRRFSPLLTGMLEDRRIVELFILAYIYRFIRLEEAGGINGSRWALVLPASQGRPEERFPLTAVDRRPSLCDAMACFVFHRADITNLTHLIDFRGLERELRAFESRASAGEESRLINMLETLTTTGLESLRISDDQAIRDLASLTRLIVDEIIQGLLDRIRASGKQFKSDMLPLIDLSAPPARDAEHANGNGAHKYAVANGYDASNGPAWAPGGPSGPREKLRELKTLLDEGLIDSDEYQRKRRAILENW